MLMTQGMHGAAALRSRGFLILWSAQTATLIGTQVTLVALPLLAITKLDAGPAELGLLNAAGYLPFLLIGLPAGVLLDRVNRKQVMITSDLSRALLIGVVVALAVANTLDYPVLYLAALLAGAFTVVFDIAYQSCLPSIVERDALVSANSRLELSRSGAQLVGPSVAGWLIAAFSPAVALLADAVSFIVSGGLLTQLPSNDQDGRGSRPGVRALRREIVEGIRFVWSHGDLRRLLQSSATLNIASAIVLALHIIFMSRTLRLPAATIGAILGVGNAGFLAAALAARRVRDGLGEKRAILLGAALASFGTFGIPLAATMAPILFLVTSRIVVTFGATLFNIGQVSLRQAVTPNNLLGRMNATMRVATWGVLPVGAVVGGLAAEALGITNTLWLAGGIAVLSLLPYHGWIRTTTGRPSRYSAGTEVP
jgi:MFS family permease